MTYALAPDPHLPASADPRGLGALLARVAGEARPLPLRGVRVRATLVGTTCRTVVEHRFANPYDQPLEAVHLLPLPEGGAVVEAELRAGEVVVRAECRERSAAEAAFAAARAQGHRAALLTAERPDVHTLTVTNLPPHEEITVRLVVVETLDVEDGWIRWRFPTTIAPRYLPGTATGHAGPGVLPDTDHAPDASRLQPPLRLAGGTALDLEVHVVGFPGRVSVSQHAVRFDLQDGLRIAPSTAATLDRDFVLAVAAPESGTIGARAWTDGRVTLVQVDPPVVARSTLPRDAVFVVDISGSMGGGKMAAAKRALVAALHGLLPGDRFKVVAFDDRVERFHAEFTPYDDRSVARADAWIHALSARGGTEMLPAVVAALDGAQDPARVRTVLFITDGQVHNDQELLAAVAHRRGAARFFTLGIDTAVNGALLTRMARMGGGACTLCTPADDIEAVVARIEARFGAPVVADVRVSGDAARPDAAVLFAGRTETFLVAGSPPSVEVTGRTVTGAWSIAAVPAPIGTDLSALWARERVAWLEDRLVLRPFEEEALRPEILRVALAAGIASRFTAFVAVERSRAVTGERIEVVQPHELPAGWDQGFVEGGGGPGGVQVACASMPPPAAAPPPSRPRAAAAPAKLSAERAELRGAPRATAAPSPAAGVWNSLDAAVTKVAAPVPPDATLAATQSADGSYGGDPRRTAAALVVLVLLGHTRAGGLRKRTVQKAAAWLAAWRTLPEVARALDLLAAAEAGAALDRGWAGLWNAGPEGELLRSLGGAATR